MYQYRIVKYLTQALFAFILKFGGLGLLALGILDSSFLFAPWGNDLLLIALVSREQKPLAMLYYAAMSAVGLLGPPRNGAISAGVGRSHQWPTG